MTQYLSAKDAAAELGISLPTLYAYVSRGLIRSEEGEGKTRAKRYRREDIEALKTRKTLRKNPTKVVEDALHWGTPILESGITLIENGRFYYRGHNALELPQNHTFEEVATLLWQGDFNVHTQFASAPAFPFLTELQPHFANLSPVDAFQIALPIAAHHDLAGYNLAPDAVARTGAHILQLETAVTTQDNLHDNIAQSLQKKWAPQQDEIAELINTALIYCADHELNVSTFTARTVASAETTPYAAVSAGLSALQGKLHGGFTERVDLFFREVSTPDNAYQTIVNRLKRGEIIPGFGHPLYPDGDPRGRELLAQITAVFPNTPAIQLAQEVCQILEKFSSAKPTIDFALVTLAWAANLPTYAPLALFAIGRTAGWIGHIIEQYNQNQMIRPRAKYSGERPLHYSISGS